MTITLTELLALESVIKEERKNKIEDNIKWYLVEQRQSFISKQQIEEIDNEIEKIKKLDDEKYKPLLAKIEERKQVYKNSLISALGFYSPQINPAVVLGSSLESCEKSLLTTAINAIKKHD